MLTAAIVIPLLGALVLALGRGWSERSARLLSIATTSVPLVLMIVAWTRFETGSGELFQQVTNVEWLPTLGVGYRVGVDGIGLALATLTALLFVAAVAYPADTRGRARQYHAWFLFLQGISLGLFLSLDLLLFYVFFDLSLVGMYFLIAMWGHENAKKAALKFFLYTLAGSLTMLLGIIALALAADPITFDMRTLTETQPLAGAAKGGLVLLALMIGLGVKTPVVPFHTWLPEAHVEAPAPASTILAGVLLKMGTFGMIRIPFSMMRDTFSRYALIVAIVGVVSILYGAFVAFGQGHLKRRIAYTSVNHMGYTVLGIGAAGMATTEATAAARDLALTGATVEMVAHGLITGALFLLMGSFWQRGHEYDMDAYGGLAGQAPGLTSATVLASFASLGLPGLAGFVAEFQIFAGTFAVSPWLAGFGLIGVLVTAALFLQLLQRVFLGELPTRWSDLRDLSSREAVPLVVLLGLTVVIGVAPGWLLRTVNATTSVLVGS